MRIAQRIAQSRRRALFEIKVHFRQKQNIGFNSCDDQLQSRNLLVITALNVAQRMRPVVPL